LDAARTQGGAFAMSGIKYVTVGDPTENHIHVNW
jgi:hypothetical protein